MARYAETVVQIEEIYRLKPGPKEIVVMKLKEVEEGLLHRVVEIVIPFDRFPIPYQKRIDSLKGKVLRLILED